MKAMILCCLVMIMCCSFVPHKFYFSNSTIEINAQNQRIEWVAKVFYDDLESALGHISGKKIAFYQMESSEINPLLAAYFQSNTSVMCNQIQMPSSFIGYELQGELIVCYIEFSSVQELHALEIKNTILINDFEDQKNVMQVAHNGATQTVLTNKQRNTAVLYY
jgi:hypothetical protein